MPARPLTCGHWARRCISGRRRAPFGPRHHHRTLRAILFEEPHRHQVIPAWPRPFRAAHPLGRPTPQQRRRPQLLEPVRQPTGEQHAGHRSPVGSQRHRPVPPTPPPPGPASFGGYTGQPGLTSHRPGGNFGRRRSRHGSGWTAARPADRPTTGPPTGPPMGPPVQGSDAPGPPGPGYPAPGWGQQPPPRRSRRQDVA